MTEDPSDQPTLGEQPVERDVHGDEQSAQKGTDVSKVYVSIRSAADLEVAAEALMKQLGLMEEPG